MDTLENPRRLRLLPYCLGGVLGVALGAHHHIGCSLLQGLARHGERGRDRGRRSSPPRPIRPPDPGAIDQSRRNAIVVASEKSGSRGRHDRVKVQTGGPEISFRNSPFPASGSSSSSGCPRPIFREYSNLGSGVIIDDDGYILTNAHVVQGAELIEVTVSDGRVLEGRIVGTATDYDLALVKIDGGKFPTAAMGDSDDLLVGEWAIAIGSPFGQLLADTQPTVTVGVISAVHRDVKRTDTRVIFDMIQTDAAINPGNSGGPLVDSRGNVIGINSSIISPNGGGSVGMGFAVPINRGKWVLEEIREHGRVRRRVGGCHGRADHAAGRGCHGAVAGRGGSSSRSSSSRARRTRRG